MVALPLRSRVRGPICIEERAARHRAVLDLDGALFIPLYVLLTLTALAWALAVSVHVKDVRGHHRPLPRWLVWLLLASLSAVVVTAALDVVENSAARLLLDLSVVPGAQVEQATVDGTRTASLHKWLATGVWAATLALIAWLQRAVLALPAWPGQSGRWPRRLVWLLVAAGVCAALALLAGAGLGLAGAGASAGPWLRLLLTVGFAAALAHAALIFALRWLRRRPRPPRQPTLPNNTPYGPNPTPPSTSSPPDAPLSASTPVTASPSGSA